MMTSQYTVREYSNGTQEIIYTTKNLRKITYSNGDIVYFDRTKVPFNREELRGGVVKIIPYNTKTPTTNYDTSTIDAIVPHTQTIAAKLYNKQKEVITNLNKDAHYYDNLISGFISCRTCNGTGEVISNEDIGQWETEGGSVRSSACVCGGEKTKITEDMVKRFFDIPLPSRDIKLVARRSAATGFDINIHATQNPALQDTAMNELESLLFDEKNADYIHAVFPPNIDYESGVSYRHFSGEVKECQAIIQQWFKSCQKKIGQKQVSLESQMQV
jgi:hypothetical protein